jgi:flavin reductase (DIM6/NTAB) family NADH-FMN oxidoreductase RutF
MPASKPDFDAPFFRTALGRFATGVTVVSGTDAAGAPIGLTISSFNSVSLNPPLVLWSLSRTSASLPAFMRCQRYVINVLAADQLALAERFARGSTPERFADRWNGVKFTEGMGGAPLLDGASAVFECFNRSRYEEGDHVIMVGQVEHCGHSGALPLVFHAGGFDLTPIYNNTDNPEQTEA